MIQLRPLLQPGKVLRIALPAFLTEVQGRLIARLVLVDQLLSFGRHLGIHSLHVAHRADALIGRVNEDPVVGSQRFLNGLLHLIQDTDEADAGVGQLRLELVGVKAQHVHLLALRSLNHHEVLNHVCHLLRQHVRVSARLRNAGHSPIHFFNRHTGSRSNRLNVVQRTGELLQVSLSVTDSDVQL